MTTVRQRCHRIDRLARELVHELDSHAYYDRKFKPAKNRATETLTAIKKVCKEMTKW